jgi:hypothetical protein
MRANSSLSSLVVVVLAIVGGCSLGEPPSVVLQDPEPPEPAPAPGPSQPSPEELLRQAEQFRASQSQGELDGVRSGTPRDEVSENVPPLPPVRRLLVFQCTDEVTFAVRSSGRGLHVYPPRYSNGYILLTQQASDAGLYFTADGAELRMSDDLATLQVGRDRYVDCVSNPAATVWQEPSRRGTPAR